MAVSGSYAPPHASLARSALTELDDDELVVRSLFEECRAEVPVTPLGLGACVRDEGLGLRLEVRATFELPRTPVEPLVPGVTLLTLPCRPFLKRLCHGTSFSCCGRWNCSRAEDGSWSSQR